MIRKSISLLALALAAAAVAAPIAQSARPRRSTRWPSSYLTGQGLSPSEVDVLDDGRLLAAGQGRFVLRDVQAAAPPSRSTRWP